MKLFYMIPQIQNTVTPLFCIHAELIARKHTAILVNHKNTAIFTDQPSKLIHSTFVYYNSNEAKIKSLSVATQSL